MNAARAPLRRTSRWLSALLVVLTLAYPLLVYLGVSHLEPHGVAALLALLALARALVARQAFWWGVAAGAGVLAALSGWGHGWLPLKLYPVLVNALMLSVFAWSVWHPPTVVERLARLAEPGLPDAAVPYTRRVTQVWCAFFAVNGAIALATALWASTEIWALYNGLLSYLAMGLLFAAEWLVRRRVRARHAAPAAPGATHG